MRICFQSLGEIKDVLFICKQCCDDKDFLGYSIRRNAHILEKTIKELDVSYKGSTIHSQIVASDLEDDLKMWEHKDHGECDTIKWAKKILAEYLKFKESEFRCTQNGKIGLRKDHHELLSIIKSRRSIRHWKNETIPTKKIEMLIDAARWAPSSCNRQTCHYLIVEKKGLIEKVGQSVKGGRYFFCKAPLLVIVLNDIRIYKLPEEKYVVYQDAAAAIQNILLMAHELELGACWGAYTSGSTIIRNEKGIRHLLAIPHFYKITGIIAIGVALESPCLVPRRNYYHIISFNKYV